ncbi:unnamed protein product, partial [Rotaria sp. Silwood1]
KGQCTCSCCKGSGCMKQHQGVISLPTCSSTSCKNACKTRYPTQCGRSPGALVATCTKTKKPHRSSLSKNIKPRLRRSSRTHLYRHRSKIRTSKKVIYRRPSKIRTSKKIIFRRPLKHRSSKKHLFRRPSTFRSSSRKHLFRRPSTFRSSSRKHSYRRPF